MQRRYQRNRSRSSSRIEEPPFTEQQKVWLDQICGRFPEKRFFTEQQETERRRELEKQAGKLLQEERLRNLTAKDAEAAKRWQQKNQNLNASKSLAQ